MASLLLQISCMQVSSLGDGAGHSARHHSGAYSAFHDSIRSNRTLFVCIQRCIKHLDTDLIPSFTPKPLWIVPQHTALFTSLRCLPISCSHLLFQDHICKPTVNPLQTPLSQSGGLFWKSSLVIPCFLCVSSLKPVFRASFFLFFFLSTSPSLPPLRLSLSPTSSSPFQLLPLLDVLLNLLPSFLSAMLPPPSLCSFADLTVSAKSFSNEPH